MDMLWLLAGLYLFNKTRTYRVPDSSHKLPPLEDYISIFSHFTSPNIPFLYLMILT